MRIPRKIMIGAAVTVTALLTAGGIAMAASTPRGLPSHTSGDTATAMAPSNLDRTHDRAGQMRGEMGSARGDMGSMRGEMGSMRGNRGGMRGDADQMRQHHSRRIERDPQMHRHHDEMIDGQSQMRGHMGAFEGSAGLGR